MRFINSMRLLMASVCLFLVQGGAVADSQNLIKNSDFLDSYVQWGSVGYANGHFGLPFWVNDWDFKEGAGIARYSAGMGGLAAYGTVAFVQNYPLPNFVNSSISQTFISNEASFVFSFDMAERDNFLGILSPGYVNIYFDDRLLAQAFRPESALYWTRYTFNVSSATADGRHSIRFLGVGDPRLDSAVYLTNVSVVAGVPELQTSSMLLLGGVLLLGLGRWRKGDSAAALAAGLST